MLIDRKPPPGATHLWYDTNGAPKTYLKQGAWAYAWQNGEWVAVAKHISSLSGKVKPL